MVYSYKPRQNYFTSNGLKRSQMIVDLVQPTSYKYGYCIVIT